jgi:hypothetical protein
MLFGPETDTHRLDFYYKVHHTPKARKTYLSIIRPHEKVKVQCLPLLKFFLWLLCVIAYYYKIFIFPPCNKGLLDY